ncbi:MAG: outer membrane beta-barrel protein [Mariprofundus sp.]|nr:outer membrane beta-barrel protein [Mariprofundus sp.]
MLLKKEFFLPALFMAFFTTQSLHAQEQEIEVYYGALGGGLYAVEYTESRPTGLLSVKQTAVPAGLLKVGVDAQLWGAELRLGLMGSASKNFPASTIGSATPFNIDVQASPFFSYLGKLQYPFTDNFKAYLLLGGTMARFAIKPGGTSVLLNSSAIKTGFTYGLGLAYKPNRDFSVEMEWIQYWTNVDMSISTAGNSRASFGGFGISVNKLFDF